MSTARRCPTAIMSLATVSAALAMAACPSTRDGDDKQLRLADYLVTARLVPDPPTTGENRLILDVKDSRGAPVEGASLDFEASMPAMGAMPEMKSGGEVRSRGGGRYDVTYSLQTLGDWSVALRIAAQGHPTANVQLSVSPRRKGLVFETSEEPLAPASRASDAGVGDVIEISPARQQLIGVTWGKAQQRPLTLSLIHI